MALNSSFRTCCYRMPKPQKNPRVSAQDRKGVFGTGGESASRRALRSGVHSRSADPPYADGRDAKLRQEEKMDRCD